MTVRKRQKLIFPGDATSLTKAIATRFSQETRPPGETLESCEKQTFAQRPREPFRAAVWGHSEESGAFQTVQPRCTQNLHFVTCSEVRLAFLRSEIALPVPETPWGLCAVFSSVLRPLQEGEQTPSFLARAVGRERGQSPEGKSVASGLQEVRPLLRTALCETQPVPTAPGLRGYPF